MAQVTLTFNDDLGNPEIHMGFAVPGSADACLSDGRCVPADQVQVGEYVQIYPGCFRRCDAVVVN